MELDSKDSEIETLMAKIASFNSETASMSSVENDGDDSVISEHGVMRLEGWLSVPNKQNIKRHGWKKQYVVVSSKKIIFYNNESDKINADPVLILDLSKVFHVRSVTQGDVIRVDAKDIPRIFQVNHLVPLRHFVQHCFSLSRFSLLICTMPLTLSLTFRLVAIACTLSR